MLGIHFGVRPVSSCLPAQQGQQAKKRSSKGQRVSRLMNESEKVSETMSREMENDGEDEGEHGLS